MSLWPWLAVAGAGALHGLNPAHRLGPCRLFRRAGSRTAADRLGHAAAVGGVAALVALGISGDGLPLAVLCGAAAALALALRRSRAGLALWSCLVASAHGSGLMLVPALVPLCLSGSPTREITASGSLLLALAAVAVHMAAMLVVTAALGLAGAKGLVRLRRGWISILGRHDLRACLPPRSRR